MEIENITSKDIREMDYNQLIGLVKETNRPPGGRKTVFEIINRACIDRESNVLEIGTSTGFTAIELSKLVKCKITSIDINQTSLREAQERASKEGLSNIKFIKADVNNLPFRDYEFDLVIIGNVLSLMSNKEKTFGECRRVCKKTGFIAAVPMFYSEESSDELIKNVSEAIQVNISPLYKGDWDDFFKIPDLEIYWTQEYKFDYIDDKTLKKFVEDIFGRDHLKNLKKDAFETLKKKYSDYIFLFRDNLSNMGFSIFLLSNKMIWEDPELYTSQIIKKT